MTDFLQLLNIYGEIEKQIFSKEENDILKAVDSEYKNLSGCEVLIKNLVTRPIVSFAEYY